MEKKVQPPVGWTVGRSATVRERFMHPQQAAQGKSQVLVAKDDSDGFELVWTFGVDPYARSIPPRQSQATSASEVCLR